MKNNSALFYTCSLIEFIGRQQKLKRSELVSFLGEKILNRVYRYADVFHCEPIEKTADDEGNIVKQLMEVYTSWIDAAISNYNTDFYYQSREYIYECYKEGKICA